ncbi:hypothetical protein ACQ4M3_27145 [Leptolyngbya sp. AN03gr2]|uniref:hypothetical protein n=1 Tax=unclassified Leptolyngbya TaxID=2650499 RepID=UPI003D31E2E0
MQDLFLFASIGLMTALVYVVRQFRQEKSQHTIVQQRLKEAREAEQLSEEMIRQLEREIHQLNQDKELLKQQSEKLYKEIEVEIEVETKELREQVRRLEERIQQLEQTNCQLTQENQDLTLSKLSGTKSSAVSEPDGAIVLTATERDLYPNERGEILVEVLKDSLRNVRENSRRQHIIADIVANNSFDSNREKMKAELQELFRDYRDMSRGTRRALERMGFEIVSESNHYKLIFQKDNRYMVAFAKTTSDWRAGRNIVGHISNLLL